MEMEKEVQRQQGESALAFEYFQLYCAMPPAERSLEKLRDRDVTGKKRSIGVIKRWSSQYNWVRRALIFDELAAAAATDALIQRRKKEIEDFIEKDMKLASKIQALCFAKVERLESQKGDVDAKELRQIAMAYRESREWLKELIGITSHFYNEVNK